MTQTSAPFFIMVVAPRPADGCEAFSYATLEGLYEGIEAQGAQVQVEHLRPATWDALAARLRDPQQPRVDMLVVDGALALDDTEVMILFENDQEAQQVKIDTLANLLAETEVGVPLLHLCQGAAADNNAPGVGQELAERALKPVVWLQPGLSREQSAACMGELLAQILAGETLKASAESAQRVMKQIGDESTTADPRIRVLGPGDRRYAPPEAQSSGISKIVSFPGRQLDGPLEQLPAAGQPGALPGEPPYQMVERSCEMAALEALLASDEPSAAWIYGYDGVGKTTLMAQVARWLVRTGRFERVVYTGIGRSGMRASALYDVGRTLLGDEFRVGEDALETVLAALQETPTLVIWDDFHAVLPGGELSSDPTSLGEWYRLAGQFATAGASRLCVLSDGPALPESARRLQGVRSLEIALIKAPQATSLLVQLCNWLEVAPPEPATIQTLLGALGEHPLALRILAAQFADAAPETVVEGLLSDLPGLASGEARFRNQAVEIAFERCVQALPEAVRQSIPSMGLFVGGFTENVGLAAMGLEREQWETGLTMLSRAGLAQAQPIGDLSIPFISVHPVLKRLARQRLDRRARQALAETFGSLYVGLASWLLQMRGNAPEQVDTLIYHDLGNMNMALELILQAQDLVMAVNYGRLYTQLLQGIGFDGEADRIVARVQKATSEAVPREGPLGRPGVLLLWDQVDRMIEAGQLGPATALLRHLVERMATQGGLNYVGREADLDRARTLYRMGYVYRLMRRPDVAVSSLRNSLETLKDLERDAAVRRQQAEIYAELAEALMMMGQLEEAYQEAQHGLETAQLLKDTALVGGFYARLGGIDMRRGRADEARESYTQALEHMQTVEDISGMAAIEGQLASLAMRPPADHGKAQEHLQRALGYAREAENVLLEGQFLAQLAQLAVQGGNLEEGEALFRETVRLYRENRIPPGLVATQANLAELLLQQGRTDEAKTEAEAALEVAQSAGGPESAPWELYLLLQRIAQAQSHDADVLRWRLATQDAFARSPQAAPIRRRWQPVIKAVVQGVRGETMDAEAAETIEEMESRPDWQALGRSIMRILSGERDETLWQELDHMDAVIVHAILEALEEDSEQDEGDDQQS